MELLTWATRYLVLASSTLSVLGLVRALGQLQAETRALQVRQQLAVESYQNILEQNQRTDLMRHEWKNQLLSLRMLQEKGEQEGLSARLRELDDELDHLTPRLYTDHLAVNTILQKAAAQADRQGIAFACQVQVPRELSIDEAELWTLLVNLLYNALEAGAEVQPPMRRDVLCRIKLSQGFLAIHCENTYSGTLRLDQAGQLVTTKANAEGHSFGLVQMRAVAEKYNSVLDISYDQDRFTVQTALALPD